MATVSPYTTTNGMRRYRVRYRTPDGRQTDKRGFVTKDDAKDYAATVEVDKRTGKYIAAAAARTTVGTLAQQWYESKVNLKPSSLDRYRQILEKHVLPRWGTTPVSKVSAASLQSWINELSRDYAPSTVRKAHGAMSMVLDVGVRDLRIATNPAAKLSLPRVRSSDHTYLSADQVFALADESGAGELVVLVLAFTGLRWGEMAALKTKRWDSSRRRLRVVESVADIGGHLSWGTPKSHQTRSVPVPAWLGSRIDAAAEGQRSDDLLFPAPKGGVMRNQNARRSWFDKAVEVADIPRITPHDLRHTAASLAISSGANVKAVQHMLGHATASMTLDLYGHLFEDDLNSVADRMPSPPVVGSVTDLRVVQ